MKTTGTRLSFAIAAFVTVASLACGRTTTDAAKSAANASPESAAAPAHVAGTGRIRGLVKLSGSPPAPESQPTTKDKEVCGQTVSLTRLALGKDNVVRQAIVYLDGIKSSEPATPRLTTEVEQKGCEYGPHVLALGAGSGLEIVNNDPILHNVHAQQPGGDGLREVFNIAQPIRGQRTKVDAPLDKPGIVTLTCEAGHPWMTAFILVSPHPYVATTNGEGEFVIDNVPPGTYPIKMWHEGVQLKQYIASLQRYIWEDPYEDTQQVVVSPGADSTVTFSLTLRPKQS